MSNYSPRLTAPDPTDGRWINVGYGGSNQCIVRNNVTGSVLPNCTGYVHGRYQEITNTYACPMYLGNADGYFTYTADGLSRGSEPALGAVLCFSGGSAGHVCIVEEIIDADTIVTSDSNYSSDYFVTYTRYRAYNWQWPGASLNFQGFIYTGDFTQNKKLLLYMAAARIKKRRKEEKAHGRKWNSSNV